MKTHITQYTLAAVLFFGVIVTISHAADTEKPKVMLGSSKADVDSLLKDWSVRKSNRSTTDRTIYYYIKDVQVVVHFRNDKAIGVFVNDRPGAGVLGIPQARYDELVALIGEKPNPENVTRDSSGIHDFYVGEIE